MTPASDSQTVQKRGQTPTIICDICNQPSKVHSRTFGSPNAINVCSRDESLGDAIKNVRINKGESLPNKKDEGAMIISLMLEFRRRNS